MKKIILLMSSCFLFCLFVLPLKTYAQALSSEDIKEQLVKDWERAKVFTVSYLNRMPADRYSFSAVDSIRSFVQQMLHLAQGNLFLMSTATDIQPPAWAQADLEHSQGALSKDSVMYYVTTSYDYCMNAVKNTPVNKWGEKKSVFGLEATRFAFMNKTFEHQTHHRGQATIYIRLLGIVPPQEQLF